MILKPKGQLDRDSAQILCEKLEGCLRRGARFLTINAELIFPILPEALTHIRNFILYESAAYLPFCVAFRSIHPRSLLVLPRRGIPFYGNDIVFSMPQYGEAMKLGLSHTRCTRCGASLRVKKAAKYTCPVCANQFEV